MSDNPVKSAAIAPVANAYEAEGLTVSPTAMVKLVGGAEPRAGLDEVFTCRMASVGADLGLKKLGVAALAVEPGKRAFPFHNHHGNDELFIVLEGEGTFRFGADEHPIKVGDICAAPCGGPETAHQIVNTGTATLRYVAVSTKQDPDVVEYPDSGKFGVMAIGEGRTFFTAKLTHIGRQENAVNYWDGEG